MGTGHDLGPHDGRFRMEQVGVDGFQRIPAHIVIAVAGGGRKMAGRHRVAAHHVQHFFGIVIFNFFHAAEGLLTAGLRPPNQFCGFHGKMPLFCFAQYSIHQKIVGHAAQAVQRRGPRVHPADGLLGPEPRFLPLGVMAGVQNDLPDRVRFGHLSPADGTSSL